MRLAWSASPQSDLSRLYNFIACYDLNLAGGILDKLITAPEKLLDFPRRGSKLSEFAPREIREFRIEQYVMRYELTPDKIRILRILHAREDRF